MKARLTQRQRAVVDSLVLTEGDVDKTAERLDNQPSTILRHIEHIHHRWGTSTIEEILAMAAEP